jgi:hypothetical protein
LQGKRLKFENIVSLFTRHHYRSVLLIGTTSDSCTLKKSL